MPNATDKFPGIFEYIISEENNFKTDRVPLSSNWNWNMYEHIDRSYTLKNSQFTKGDNDFNRPFNNIIIPIANVNYRTEGFDVKDVEVFVNDKENYHKSLLTRKFHHKWAKKWSIDTAIDESVESHFDYGLILVKNVNDKRPEVIQPQQIAFCDQRDILSGPICLKHQYTISELLEMKGKWDDDAIDKAVVMSRFSTKNQNGLESKSPGKSVEVYELHGVFPEAWLEDDYLGDNGKYSPQLHILTYYVDEETGNKNGIHLFKGPEKKPIFKALKRDPIFGRACGRGGIEELFHPQIWTNYSEIHMQQMLEATSKVVLQTADKKLAKDNKVNNLKHNQVLTHEEGKPLSQLVLQPFNKTAFDNYVNKWEQAARTLGSASDPQLGLNPVSGTPLGTTEIVTDQGEGVHEYRQGKIAQFWGEIYRDWVINYLVKDMMAGDEWLEELTLDELKDVAEIVSTNKANEEIENIILNNGVITEQEAEYLKSVIKQDFVKGGKKRFMKLIKDELKDIPVDVDFTISGKQKDLFNMVNKLNAVFRTVFANPAVLQQPGMDDLFNQILESSGLSPINFASLMPVQQLQQSPEVMAEANQQNQPSEEQLAPVAA